jgi:hypothetical protein
MKTTTACLLAVVVPSFFASSAPAEMTHWTYVVSATADPPSFGTQIQAPHPEPSPSNTFPSYAIINLHPAYEDRPHILWNVGYISGSVQTRVMSFDSGVTMSSAGTLGEIHGGYHFTMTIGDFASRAIGSLTFAGRFDGFVGNDSDMTRVSHTYIGPTTGQLHLGANLYAVRVLPFQPVDVVSQEPFSPDPRVINDPHIDATVDVRRFVSDTPEPSTFCIAAVGLAASCAAGVYRRLRRS